MKPKTINRATNVATCGGLLLAFVFVTLKLSDYIFWSWWLVTAPAWLPFVIIFLIVLIVVYCEK